MALVQVQHQSGTSVVSANTLAVTVAATGSGNLIIAGCLGSGSDTITSVTDSAGSTYVQATGARAVSGGGRVTDVWYCVSAIAGATTVTVHYGLTNTNRKEAYVHEVSGADASSPFDAAGILTDTGTGGTSNTGAAVTTVAANTYIIGIIRTQNTAVNSGAGGGFTNDDVSSAGGAVHRIASAQATYTPVYHTVGIPTDDAYSTVSFKQSSGAAFLPDEDFSLNLAQFQNDPNITVWQ